MAAIHAHKRAQIIEETITMRTRRYQTAAPVGCHSDYLVNSSTEEEKKKKNIYHNQFWDRVIIIERVCVAVRRIRVFKVWQIGMRGLKPLDIEKKKSATNQDAQWGHNGWVSVRLKRHRSHVYSSTLQRWFGLE